MSKKGSTTVLSVVIGIVLAIIISALIAYAVGRIITILPGEDNLPAFNELATKTLALQGGGGFQQFYKIDSDHALVTFSGSATTSPVITEWKRTGGYVTETTQVRRPDTAQKCGTEFTCMCYCDATVQSKEAMCLGSTATCVQLPMIKNVNGILVHKDDAPKHQQDGFAVSGETRVLLSINLDKSGTLTVTIPSEKSQP